MGDHLCLLLLCRFFCGEYDSSDNEGVKRTPYFSPEVESLNGWHPSPEPGSIAIITLFARFWILIVYCIHIAQSSYQFSLQDIFFAIFGGHANMDKRSYGPDVAMKGPE